MRFCHRRSYSWSVFEASSGFGSRRLYQDQDKAWARFWRGSGSISGARFTSLSWSGLWRVSLSWGNLVRSWSESRVE